MPFQVVCPGCQKKYNLADEVRGKTIRCSACSKTFRTPPAAQPAPAAPAVPNQGQRVAAPPRPGQPTQQGNTPLRNENDLFAGAQPNPQFDPLGNHVIHDPGFVQVDPSKYAKPAESELDDDSLFYNPATADLLKKVEEARDEASREHRLFWLPTMIGGSWVAGAFATAIPLLFLNETAAVIGAIICLFPSIIVSIAADIWLLVIIYRNDNDRFILSLFIAFFRYQYLSQHWERYRDLGTFYAAGVLGCVGTTALFFIIGAVYGE